MTAKTVRVGILALGVLLGLYGWQAYNPVAFVGIALIALALALHLTRHRGGH